MRHKLFILFILVYSFVLSGAFAVEEVLIDFNNLKDTTIDYSKFSNGNYDEVDEMQTSLHPDNWLVKVNPSSFTLESKRKSYAMGVSTFVKYEDDVQVLAVRAFLPQMYANSNITITPPFEIPAFYISQDKIDAYKDDPEGAKDDSEYYMGKMFINKGVVRNVAAINKIRVNICGHNFNYQLYVRLKDNYGRIRDIFVGYIRFKGWQEIVWNNPNTSIRNPELRHKLRESKPYYPGDYPYVKLIGFYVSRVETEAVGNFVTMIKDVILDYEEENIDLHGYNGNDLVPSIENQEKIFGIYKEELIEVANVEIEKANRYLMNQWIEKKKMHSDEAPAAAEYNE